MYDPIRLADIAIAGANWHGKGLAQALARFESYAPGRSAAERRDYWWSQYRGAVTEGLWEAQRAEAQQTMPWPYGYPASTVRVPVLGAVPTPKLTPGDPATPTIWDWVNVVYAAQEAEAFRAAARIEPSLATTFSSADGDKARALLDRWERNPVGVILEPVTEAIAEAVEGVVTEATRSTLRRPALMLAGAAAVVGLGIGGYMYFNANRRRRK